MGKPKQNIKMYCNKRQNMSFRPITISNDFDLVPFFNCYTPPRKIVKCNPYRSNFRSFQEPNFETMFDEILPFREISRPRQVEGAPIRSLEQFMNLDFPQPEINAKPENTKVLVNEKENTITVEYSEKSKNGQSFYKKVESLPKYVSDQKSHKMIKSKIIDGQIKIILPENVEAIQASEKPKEIEDAVAVENADENAEKKSEEAKDVVIIDTIEDELDIQQKSPEMENSETILQKIE